jgi:hypothetical protein
MGIQKLVHNLRQKPQRVRERIVLVLFVVISPILFIVWSLTFQYTATGTSADLFKKVGATISGTFSNPLYKNTFGTPVQH